MRWLDGGTDVLDWNFIFEMYLYVKKVLEFLPMEDQERVLS